VRVLPALAVAAGVGLAVVLGVGAGRFLRDLDAVEVRGRSMVPTLEPGDWLLVETWTYRRRAPRVGEVVVTPDPRSPARELVKRVAAVEEGQVRLRGDAARSTDSRRFGAVPLEEVRSRAAFRYWPPTRAGFIATTDTITDAAPD
jgi:nickel-type superoxide dismutase maturation protease